MHVREYDIRGAADHGTILRGSLWCKIWLLNTIWKTIVIHTEWNYLWIRKPLTTSQSWGLDGSADFPCKEKIDHSPVSRDWTHPIEPPSFPYCSSAPSHCTTTPSLNAGKIAVRCFGIKSRLRNLLDTRVVKSQKDSILVKVAQGQITSWLYPRKEGRGLTQGGNRNFPGGLRGHLI